MSDCRPYKPGAADVARVVEDGETWTLVLEEDLRHAPDKVWRATPPHLREWAPFDASGDVGAIGVHDVT